MIQLQNSFALLVSFSSLSSVTNKQLLVTNKGRNLCREGDKLNLKYTVVETFDFSLLWEFLSSFCILSKIVEYKISLAP